MSIEEIWRQKSDRELEFAAIEIADYTEEAQEVIRAEIQKRGISIGITKLSEISAPKLALATDEPHLLGDFLERSRNSSFSEWVSAIILALTLSILGGLILLYGAGFSSKLLISIACISLGIGIIYRATQFRKHYLLIYQKGIVYEQPNGRFSAYYEELKIWQENLYLHPLDVYIKVSRSYSVEFPKGNRLNVPEDLRGQLQVLLIQHRLPQVLDAYNQDHTVEFGPIRVHKKGLVIHGQGIAWSNISRINVRKGVIYISTLEKRLATAKVPVSEVPNLQVLLSFLKQIGYYQA